MTCLVYDLNRLLTGLCLESNCRTSTVFCTTFMRINAEIDPKKLMLEAKVCYYTTQLLILPSKAFRTRETTGTKGKVSRQEHKKASPEWLPSPLARAVAFGWERVPRLTKQTNGVGQKSPAITCITSTVELQLFDHLKPWGLLKCSCPYHQLHLLCAVETPMRTIVMGQLWA